MRVIAGPEKKSRLLSEKERVVTAYHEMGHALVGHFLPNADPVHKISVVSRGQALGYTISMPDEDKFLTTKAQLEDAMAMTLGAGGRGDRLRRDHHRRRQRPGEGHPDRQADDDALWHVRQAGPARARPQPRRPLPGAATCTLSPTTRTTWPAPSTRRSGASSRRPTSAPATSWSSTARTWRPSPRSCCGARRSSARSSWPCSRAPPRTEVFAERDRRAAELEAEAKRAAEEPERKKRLPYPAAGDPIPGGWGGRPCPPPPGGRPRGAPGRAGRSGSRAAPPPRRAGRRAWPAGPPRRAPRAAAGRTARRRPGQPGSPGQRGWPPSSG